MPVGAWKVSECSEDSNTVVVNRRVGLLGKKLAHLCSGSAVGRPGSWEMVSPGYSILLQELLGKWDPGSAARSCEWP